MLAHTHHTYQICIVIIVIIIIIIRIFRVVTNIAGTTIGEKKLHVCVKIQYTVSLTQGFIYTPLGGIHPPVI